MSQPAQNSPLRLPEVAAWALRPLPLPPLRFMLTGLAKSIVRRHPELHERLDAYRGRGIGIAPTDAPFAIIIEPSDGDLTLHVVRKLSSPAPAATVRGPLLALLGLVNGSYDGDALFFSRDIAVDGDIGAVVALRNAIDDAQIDLLDEAAATLGPAAGYALNAVRGPMTSFVNALSRHRQMTG